MKEIDVVANSFLRGSRFGREVQLEETMKILASEKKQWGKGTLGHALIERIELLVAGSLELKEEKK